MMKKKSMKHFLSSQLETAVPTSGPEWCLSLFLKHHNWFSFHSLLFPYSFLILKNLCSKERILLSFPCIKRKREKKIQARARVTSPNWDPNRIHAPLSIGRISTLQMTPNISPSSLPFLSFLFCEEPGDKNCHPRENSRKR